MSESQNRKGSNKKLYVIFISLALTLLLAAIVILVAFQGSLNSISIIFLKSSQLLLNSVRVTIMNLLNEFNTYFWVYFPLGIIGIWRWSVWTIKKICAMQYSPIIPSEIPGYHTTMSVVTPVYDENPEIFREALESWDANSADEIIAVIDVTDTNCINVFKNFSYDKPYAKLIVTSKPGKRPALADGILQSKGQIVALVDSDVIWAPGVRKILLAPFRDAKIGGVTASQYSAPPENMLQKIGAMLWSQRNYLEWPSQVAMGKVIMCLSGRTSLYRRRILLPKLDYFLNEIILGRKKESGEDKCLTRVIQKDGWNTYYQRDANVFSKIPPDFKTFWNQRVRWTRNSFNSDLLSFWEGWIWHHRFLAFVTIDRLLSLFPLYVGPITFGFAILKHDWYIAISILLLWLIGRGIKLYPYLRTHKQDVILVPVYVVSNFIFGAARIYALFAIRRQKWIRANKREEEKKEKNILNNQELIIGNKEKSIT
jgi:N-acetylglucosaminyltransferase